MVFETLVQYGHLTWLIAREDDIEVSTFIYTREYNSSNRPYKWFDTAQVLYIVGCIIHLPL